MYSSGTHYCEFDINTAVGHDPTIWLGFDVDMLRYCHVDENGAYTLVASNALEDVSPDPTELLSQCQGNCTSDYACEAHLLCHLDVASVIPGCDGVPTDGYVLYLI